jgi:hypothetical protein
LPHQSGEFINDVEWLNYAVIACFRLPQLFSGSTAF